MCKKCRCLFSVIGFMTVVIGTFCLCCGKKKKFLCVDAMNQCCKDVKEDLTDVKEDVMDVCQDVKKAGSDVVKAVMEKEPKNGSN